MWVLKRIKFKETYTRTIKSCQRLKNIIKAFMYSSSVWQSRNGNAVYEINQNLRKESICMGQTQNLMRSWM
jgi:hypothetical protein